MNREDVVWDYLDVYLNDTDTTVTTTCNACGTTTDIIGIIMNVYTITNQKGGTSKTTTAVHLAAVFAERGQRVLILDNDPQGHVGLSLGVRGVESVGTVTLYRDVDASLEGVIQSTLLQRDGEAAGSRERLQLVPATLDLVDAERDATSDLAGGLFRLADRAEAFRHACDVLIIDCPPNLGALTLNAFVLTAQLVGGGAQGGLIVPVAMGMLDVQGLGALIKTTERLRARDLAPEIIAVVPVQVEANTLITRDVLDVLQQRFGERVTRPVRKSVRFREAPAQGLTIFEFDPEGNGAEDYRAVAEDVIRLTNMQS